MKNEILEELKESTLFKDVNSGEAREAHLEAMKDKDKIFRIAKRHGLGMLIYALYRLGFKSGKSEIKKDLEWLLRAYIPNEPENRGMTIGEFHEKCEAIREKHGIEKLSRT